GQKLDEMRKNADDAATRQAADAMKKWTGRRPDDVSRTPREGPAQPGAEADPRFRDQAGAMNLQKFQDWRRKLTPEEMNELQITGADLKALEEMYRRREAEPRDPERLADPSRTGVLPSQGVRKVEGANPNAGGAQRGGPTMPPPDLRDGQNEFTKSLSE